MDRKEVVYHLKGRWERVKEREIAELRETPFKVRFAQTATLMQFAKSLKWGKRQKEEKNIRSCWEKLRRRSDS